MPCCLVWPICKANLQSGYEAWVDKFKLLPPSVAFKKQYGNVPTIYNTGQPGYSLPIHTIEVDATLAIPLPLSYAVTPSF